ncbi:MAG: tetratricopeptide repeat protein [Treponema sp.]|nr:tetratricopeptide repeat protein [Treponema sp.]
MWDDDKSDWKYDHSAGGHDVDANGYDKYGSYHHNTSSNTQDSNSYSPPSHSSASNNGWGTLILLGIGGFIIYKIVMFIQANWVSIVTILGICVACVITCIIIWVKAKKPGLKTLFTILTSIGLIVATLYFGPGKMSGKMIEISDELVAKIKHWYTEGVAFMSSPIAPILGIGVVCAIVGIVILKKSKKPGEKIQANKEFAEAIKLDSNDAQTYAKRATAYYEKGQYDQAIKDFNEVIRLNPNNDWAYASRGEACFQKGQYDSAISDCTEAIRLNPNNALAYSTRGGAYYDKKEYDQAIKNFDEAIRLNPNIAFAYGMRGEAYRMIGQHDQAISDYTEVIRIDPDNAFMYATRGATYWWMKGQRDQAISDSNMALKLDPNNELAKEVLQSIPEA